MSTHSYRTLLGRYLRPHAARFAALTVLLLAGVALSLIGPQIIRYYIDAAKDGATMRALLIAGAIYIAGGFVRTVVTTVGQYVTEDVGWRATNDLRTDLAGHCLRLDMGFHNDTTPGAMVERVDGDVTAIAGFFSQFTIRVVGSGLLLVGQLALIAREDWRLGAALTTVTALAVLLMLKLRHIAVPWFKAEREGFSDLFGFVEERLAGIEDIRTNGGVGYTMNRMHALNTKLFGAVKKAEMRGHMLSVATDSLFTLSTAAVLAGGILLYRSGAFTIGTVYLVLHYATMLRYPLRDITWQLEEFQKAIAGISRVGELMDREAKTSDGARDLPVAGAGSVAFDNVTFGYAADDPVLRDLSFRVEPGRVLGLLGRTGSGKTTITRLLFRLYDTDSGVVSIDGVDIAAARTSEVRRRVAMVTQDVHLFRASLRDNLSLFAREVDDEAIVSVLADLGLGDWYAALPDGLDSVLESKGVGMSAGQQQLLAFARVFLRDPGIVVLDEPSSRLDPGTEQRVEAAVARLLAGRTGIIIAHRLETLRRVDDILILDDGRIAEWGPRVELAADSGSRFAGLLRTGMDEELS
jgi:ATP-binding cassette, subfamily B, bacterial